MSKLRRGIIIGATIVFLILVGAVGAMSYIQSHSGFDWDLALFSGCTRLDPGRAEGRVNTSLRNSFSVALPSGSRIINAGDKGPDHESWFEISMPAGTAAEFAATLVAKASPPDWRSVHTKTSVDGGSGSNIRPQWWKAQEMLRTESWKFDFIGQKHVAGPWTYTLAVQPGEDRMFLWMQFDN
jgi:hypothetical protein